MAKAEAQRVESYLHGIIQSFSALKELKDVSIADWQPNLIKGKYVSLRSKFRNPRYWRIKSTNPNPRGQYFDCEPLEEKPETPEGMMAIAFVTVNGVWHKLQKMTEKDNECMWGLSLSVNHVVLPQPNDSFMSSAAFRARSLTSKMIATRWSGEGILKMDSYDPAKRKGEMTEEQKKAAEEKKKQRAEAREKRKSTAKEIETPAL